MNFTDNNIPESIRKRISGKEYRIDHTGMSASQVVMFDNMILKIQKPSSETDNEYQAVRWLSHKIPVPEILEYEVSDGTAYTLMTKMPGEMLCEERYMNDPAMLLDIIAEAMECLWKADISGCPCDNSLNVKLKAARYNVEHGLADIGSTQPDTFGENRFRSPEELLRWLEENRPEEDLVLSHGDFCLPNIFAVNGRLSGFIDLGRMGVSDRWCDIAICHRSLAQNFAGMYNGGRSYGGYRPEMLFDRLGIKADRQKVRYYILLDELF